MAFILLLKRLLVVAIIFICFDGTAKMIKGCHPTSKALHICLNIYLEKDFPLIETFVKSRRHGRVLLEDPDLQNICRHIASLNDCYNSLWGECTSYWQVERYSRLIHLINSTHSYLCSNTTDVLKDLLINLDCLARARDYLAKCSHAGFNWMTTWKQIMRLRILSTESCPMLNDYKSCMVQELEGVICEVLLNTDCMSRAKPYIANCSSTGFDWMMTWKQILRMQVSPEDRCHALGNYKTCLSQQLMNIPCGMESTRVYGNLIEVWLKNWCDKDSSPSSAMKYFYRPVTFRSS